MECDSQKRAVHEVKHGKKLAHSNAEKVWGWNTPAGRKRAARRAELIITYAQLCAGRKVLEIGCGTGLFTEYFAATQADIIAVDISPELLDIARRRQLDSRVSFVEKRFEDCDIDGPFDAVVGSSILHHLEMPDALVKIHGLLKDGGIACFAEPNMLNPQIALQKNIPFIKKIMGDSPDETAFIRWRFAKQLYKAGFENVSIMPFDFLHPFTPAILIKPVEAAGRFFEKIPGLREIAGSLIIIAGKHP